MTATRAPRTSRPLVLAGTAVALAASLAVAVLAGPDSPLALAAVVFVLAAGAAVEAALAAKSLDHVGAAPLSAGGRAGTVAAGVAAGLLGAAAENHRCHREQHGP